MTAIDHHADILTDQYRDRHGSTSHMHSQAADEAQSLALAIGWVEIALASARHHGNQYCVLANVKCAIDALEDAQQFLAGERAVMARLGGAS